MLRTLIIDDNPLFLASLRELLGLFAGVRLVGEARSGDEGLRRAAELVPDLVFVDMHMPDLDGFHVTEQLRRVQPQIRVVMMSWHDDAEYRARAAVSGAERFVCKSTLLTKLPAIISGPPAALQAAGAAS